MVLRYSEGDEHNGYSVTGMVYHGLWTNTTDIPVRAIAEGLVPDRFGTLDPTDGGRAWRASLSFNGHATFGAGQFTASAFFIDNQLHLFNDFTHFLADPIHGDQEDQIENRQAFGGQANYTLPVPLGLDPERAVGRRADALRLAARRTRCRARIRCSLPAEDDPPSFSNDDRVWLFAGAAYVQATTHWTPKFRSVLGFRDDYQHGTDIDYVAALHETAGYSNAARRSSRCPSPRAA